MSEPLKLEEDFRSIVVGGLISRASARPVEDCDGSVN